jgi:hypothetical protein
MVFWQNYQNNPVKQIAELREIDVGFRLICIIFAFALPFSAPA